MSKRHRRLAAIVFTDIVGYSSLMQEDEGKALQIRERHRTVFDDLTPKYNGKIIQYYGDGTLSIFRSAVDAVECSVEMQKAFREDPAVPLRIGIHTGDITYSKEEVFGDGVNVAARIEAACIPGGIFISRKVYDEVKNHSWVSATSVGQFQFKSIKEGIELLAISCDDLPVPSPDSFSYLRENAAKILAVNPGERRSGSNLALKFREGVLWLAAFFAILMMSANFFFSRSGPQPLPALPAMDGEISIAVLPFTNFSENKEDEYFSNGITEDILTLLSNIKDFRVISRTSVMQYKDTDKSIRQIGQELNVSHVLEGSVRKSGNKVRVVAQLIDAQNDSHLWAATFDREMTEIFEVQSEVAQEIAGTLKKELSPTEQASIHKKPTKSLQAYEYYLQGRGYYGKYNKKDNEIAIELFKNAIEMDSFFALAYAGLGDALSQKANFEKGDPGLLDSATQVSKKAIALDKNCSEGHKALGLAYHYKGEADKALDAYHKAVELNPNNDMAISNIAMICQDRGKVAEGLVWAKKAKELNPHHPMTFMRLADLYQSIGMEQQAENMLVKGMSLNPDNQELHLKLGNLELKRQRYEKAKEKAMNIIGMNSDNPEGYALLGNAAFLEGDFQKAHKNFVQAKALVPEHKGFYNRYEIDLGIILSERKLKGGEAEATQLYKILDKIKSEDQSKSNARLYFLSAIIYSTLGENDKALGELEKAKSLGFLDYQLLQSHPSFEPIRTDEKFKRITEGIQQKVQALKKEFDKEIS